ncbi:Short chain aldehyde dehydrogenase 1 [Linum grandiflorum]
MAKRLQGKVALIIGGARGLGGAAARLFAQHGAKVLIADIRPELGRTIESETGEPVSFIQCDVTSDDDMRNAVDAVVSAHGKLDIMYNNAGIVGEKIKTPELDISSVDLAVFRRVFDVNVYGSFLAAKHAARVMIPQKSGTILLTASSTTVSHGICPHVYAASKDAVAGLMKNLCVELGKLGIRVNCISPSAVATPAALEATGMPDAASLEAAFAATANLKVESTGIHDVATLEAAFAAKANLKGMVLKAENAAEAALNLVSDESKYISGMNLVVDGGNCLVSAGL